jgi:hypothetical protein
MIVKPTSGMTQSYDYKPLQTASEKERSFYGKELFEALLSLKLRKLSSDRING